MEDYGYKYIHQVSQLITNLASGEKCLTDLIPKNVNISDFPCLLYSKPLREYKKPKLMIGDRICKFKNDLPFSKFYKPQFTQHFQIRLCVTI